MSNFRWYCCLRAAIAVCGPPGVSAVSHSIVSASEELFSHVGADSDAVAELPAHSSCLAGITLDTTVIKSVADIADKHIDLGASGSQGYPRSPRTSKP